MDGSDVIFADTQEEEQLVTGVMVVHHQDMGKVRRLLSLAEVTDIHTITARIFMFMGNKPKSLELFRNLCNTDNVVFVIGEQHGFAGMVNTTIANQENKLLINACLNAEIIYSDIHKQLDRARAEWVGSNDLFAHLPTNPRGYDGPPPMDTYSQFQTHISAAIAIADDMIRETCEALHKEQTSEVEMLLRSLVYSDMSHGVVEAVHPFIGSILEECVFFGKYKPLNINLLGGSVVVCPIGSDARNALIRDGDHLGIQVDSIMVCALVRCYQMQSRKTMFARLLVSDIPTMIMPEIGIHVFGPRLVCVLCRKLRERLVKRIMDLLVVKFKRSNDNISRYANLIFLSGVQPAVIIANNYDWLIGAGRESMFTGLTQQFWTVIMAVELSSGKMRIPSQEFFTRHHNTPEIVALPAILASDDVITAPIMTTSNKDKQALEMEFSELCRAINLPS